MKWSVLFLLFFSTLFSSEKGLTDLREKLQQKYEESLILKQENAPLETFKELLDEINQIKKEISSLEESFKTSELKDDWGYWDMGEITVGQLVMEYGSCDFLYIIPQELKEMKLQLFSMVSIDRKVWDEMLELILSYNGIGVRKLNSYAKQLFLLKTDMATIHAVVSKIEELSLVADHKRVFYILSPKPEQLKLMQGFFEKFSDPKQTSIQAVGTKVVLVSTKQNVERLLSVYQAVWENNEGKTIKVIPLSKVTPSDAEKVLKSFFSQGGSPRPSFRQNLIDELQILNIPQGIVFIGEKKSVNRAEKVLLDLEQQLSDPKEMTVFWYQCKHTDPEDLAKVLEEVYDSLTFCTLERKNSPMETPKKGSFLPNGRAEKIPASNPDFQDRTNKTFKNFIVDAKLGGIMMVVRRDKLSKIEDLLKRLDAPKKMVEIDVLLVEKKIQDRTRTGINLLKIGGSSNRQSSISFDTNSSSPRKGILDFILSKPKGKSPAFDFTFSLLLAQEDIQIHANPSVLATNQTPATISLVEEISINNGAIPIEGTSNTRGFEKSFTRAQYGTTIIMTPMIHETEEKDFVTLQTNITFDTTQMSQNDRPPVTRRHVENEICVADGETIVIGGLSRKTSESSQEKIPFLGNLPGIGKIFGTKITNDSNTEMFIFITPKIVKDPTDEMRLKKREDLLKRPGDLPEFLVKMQAAKTLEKKYLFQESIELLFDRF